MAKDEREHGLERRGFLKGLGIAAGGAAAAVVPGRPAEADEAGNPSEQAKKRYQETPHVKRFYALNRL
jgi:hypothetical protein